VTAGLLLIRRLRPIGEPDLRPIEGSRAASLDGTAGAARIIHALAGAGVRCDPVVQLVVPADIEIDELASLADERDFETVVVGSHLVNLPDEALRGAIVDVAVRHVAPGGSVIVEHHPVDWTETAADVEPTPGSAVGMEDVRRAPPFVSAVSVFDVGGRMFRQPFTARVLSERDLAEVLERTGLRISRRISPTLLEARLGA